MEAEWADHWFAIETAEKPSSWLSGSAGISVLVQVGLALQEPSPHARDSSLTVVAGTPPDGLLSPRNLSPGQPLSRSGRPIGALSQQGHSAWRWMRRRLWVWWARKGLTRKGVGAYIPLRLLPLILCAWHPGE